MPLEFGKNISADLSFVPTFYGREVMSKHGEHEYSGLQNQRAQDDSAASTEREVEKLVGEIGSVIRAAEPQRRGELKELAETLVHEEMSTIPAQAEAAKESFAQHRVNPLAGGIFLTVIGAGFALIVTPVGLGLVLIGLLLIIWGAIMSWTEK